MKRNTKAVGEYTLTVSMATLYQADKALSEAKKPTVMETFIKMLPAVAGGEIDASKLDITGLDFESFVLCLAAFLYPDHKLSLDDALNGPLSEGSPVDWLGALFSLLMGTSPQSDDALSDDDVSDNEEQAGNSQAA